jgi:hypothetical protein
VDKERQKEGKKDQIRKSARKKEKRERRTYNAHYLVTA